MNICDSNSDIISHVPGNILENILSCLPLQDAVRTSLLSRKWRYVWPKRPQLVFDEMFYRDLHRTTHAKLLMIIYQVLLHHRGPIIKFTLSLSGLESCSEIDQLILFVSSNDIQDFTFRIWKGELYKLLSLDLSEVVIAEEVLSSLISSCPLLEDLTLFSSTGLDSLEVIGPNLKSVSCDSHISSICFTNTSRLANVELFCSFGEISSSVVLLDSVPVIEFLELDFCYVKGIAACGVPTRLPTTLNNLKYIFLNDICFGERDEALPNKTSAIPIVQDFVEVHVCSDVSLNQLRKVDMKNVSGTKPELEFIKLLLAKSSMLETMLFERISEEVSNELRIVKELTGFRRLKRALQSTVTEKELVLFLFLSRGSSVLLHLSRLCKDLRGARALSLLTRVSVSSKISSI
ncbi:hypothetical protein C3L33_13619, partial [Rhododendron williamsianum]